MVPRAPMQGAPLPAGLLADLLPLIDGLSADSRLVRPGMGFAAFPGEAGDGRHWIADAIGRGASAVLWEPEGWQRDPSWCVPDLPVPALRERASQVADLVYGHPSAALRVIGVTGTNGKTSITSLIAQALGAAGTPCGLIGTLGAGMPGALRPTGFTTPGPVELPGQLADLRAHGALAVAMEVSSHGLALGRVDAVRFDLAVFTNLTRDHLDFHGTMEAYGAAKEVLFHAAGLRRAIINVDDAFGEALDARLRNTGIPVLACSQAPHTRAEIRAEGARFGPEGTDFRLHAPGGSADIHSRLLGRFNLSNLLAVLAVLLESGIPMERLPELAAALQPPAGRLERIGKPGGIQAVIDYAHTPDALEQVLVSLRSTVAGGRLICVFGCGGDRDPGKRPQMGAIAERLADIVVLTSDNPRGEHPGRILDEVLAGMRARPALVEEDRARAIVAAVRLAVPGDIVLIAGKGHETTQEIGGIKTPFSDLEHAQRALGLMGEGR